MTLLTCGGTIAMTTCDGVRVPASSSVVADTVRALDAGITLTHVAHAELDSAQTEPGDWTRLAVTVAAAGDTPVLITHGTDTLAWTAAALAAAGCGATHPVVLTGANVPLGAASSDAGVNLTAALRATQLLPAGVWVVFAGLPDTPATVIQGGYARKLHEGGACFVDVAGTPYATVAGDETLTVTGTRRVHPVVPAARFEHPVALERCWPGLALPDAAPAPTLILELYPCATVSDRIAATLASWTAAGTTVLAVPPAPLEVAAYPSTAQLEAAGVSVALGLTPELACCLAMVGWSAGPHRHHQAGRGAGRTVAP